MRNFPTNGHRQQGFVLAVVLWSIAALTLITGGIMVRINQTLEDAFRLRELAQREQGFMATEQTLLYLLSARPLNPAGTDLSTQSSSWLPRDPFAAIQIPDDPVPTLRYDSRPYPGVGQAWFALQDTGALFSLIEPNIDNWRDLMEQLGLTRTAGDRWLDQLLDYQDRDSLPRLNGSEAPKYRALGLPPPSNRFLTTPDELRNLPFARENPQVTERLIGLSGASGGNGTNLNTAPAELLSINHHLSATDAQRVVARRSQRAIYSGRQASETLGVMAQGNELQTLWLPTQWVRLVLLDAEGRQRRRIAVNFTPNTRGEPWLIEYYHPVALDQRLEESDSTDAFSANRQTEAAPPATSWALYSTFFPEQLPVER